VDLIENLIGRSMKGMSLQSQSSPKLSKNRRWIDDESKIILRSRQKKEMIESKHSLRKSLESFLFSSSSFSRDLYTNN
jgi:hypothetical protein